MRVSLSPASGRRARPFLLPAIGALALGLTTGGTAPSALAYDNARDTPATTGSQAIDLEEPANPGPASPSPGGSAGPADANPPDVEYDDPAQVDPPIDDPSIGGPGLRATNYACRAYGTPATDAAARAIDRACAQVGRPYVYGAGHDPVPGPSGGPFDCSGLVRYAYYNPSTWGDVLGRNSTKDQFSRLKGTAGTTFTTSWANLKPGDLVYWSKTDASAIYHATIYLGSDYYVSALNEKSGVIVGKGKPTDFYQGVRLPGSKTPAITIRRDHVSDFNGDGKADVFGAHQTGILRYYQNAGRGDRYSAPRIIGSAGWQNMRWVQAADFSGDGAADILGIDGKGDLYYYPNNNYSLSAKYKIGAGWNTQLFVMTADWTGDGRADMLTVTPNGDLWIYPHASGSKFNTPIKIGIGWQNMRFVTAADWDHDGRADIIAVDRNGDMWLYPHAGGNSFSAKRKIGQGWSGMAKMWAADASGDGYADVMAVTSDGTLRYYGHNGSGLSSPAVVGSGWQNYSFVF